MFSHVILGLLRDGEQRHGYELTMQYRLRSGTKMSPGNFYRELTRLMNAGLVQTGSNPPGADARRIPYTITERGRQVFDRWLASPTREDEDIGSWLLFVHLVDREARDDILERYREDLWMRNKLLTRTRDDALRARREKPEDYDPLPVIVARQIKQVSAELSFLDEFRAFLEDADARREAASRDDAATQLATEEKAPRVTAMPNKARRRARVRS
ncbi:MAG TPA: PadR family transcriptional regulator [Candidatus Binatia bacterium]|nr:PadR family transcriptional regulator [Candidatus Binatia bacterium]